MFTRAPDVGCMLDKAADQYFANIDGVDFEGDQSFVAALRVLLKKRIPEDTRVKFCIRSVSSNAAVTENEDWANVFIEAANGMIADDAFTIVNLTGFSPEQKEKLFGLLEEGFARQHGLEYQKDISDYVKPVCGMRFHVSDERHAAVVFVCDLTPQRYHFLQTLICRAFRGYFKENPPDEEEKDFIKSAKERTSEAYNRCFKKLASRFDLAEARSALYAQEFFQKIRKVEAEKIHMSVLTIERMIENYMNELSKKYGEKRRLLTQLLGLEAGVNSEAETEFMDYIRRNKFIRITHSDDGNLTFLVRCTLDFFSEDILKRLRATGALYDIPDIVREEFRDPGNRRLLIDALFPNGEDPGFKINLQAEFTINQGRARTRKFEDFEFDENRTFNPHYQYFRCLGSNEPNIAGALGYGDYATAIEYCVAAARGVDLNEWRQTARPFISEVLNSGRRILHNEETGEDMTPVEALKWLKEREGKTE